MTADGRSEVWQIKHLPAGSGKSVTMALLAWEAKRSARFTASTRMVKRVMRQLSSTAEPIVAGTSSPGSSSNIDDPPSSGSGRVPGFFLEVLTVVKTDSARWALRSRRRAIKEAFECAFALVDEQPASLSNRLHQAFRSSRWSAALTAIQLRQATALDLARAMSKLAMAARSVRGLPSASASAQPPGEFVRTHPRVPRGPSAALCSATSWPSGGVLSVV
ncbi:hypothetical protein [Couchioplanes caeruleus]|uniref:Uncharacterized protein n=1 Tax=Couchioplanes caeruleus subsp. caeruleus TaxID=56427 RepID=A0A1K0GWH3_9ACTN|nr:hypothetical protein [Couchioplanes caeruleus]OJF13747.1 hypothetical protein BG844_13500 [Couchioplanes caeruleus subsp. caeruleus]